MSTKRKKNKKQDKTQNKQASVGTQLHAVSSEELKQIIVEAILKAEEEKREKMAQHYKKEKEEWSKLFGEEDYSGYKGLSRLKLEAQCVIRMIKKIVTVKDIEIKESFCAENFIKAIIMVIFIFGEYIAYFGALTFLLGVFFQLWDATGNSKWLAVVWLALGFCIFLWARLFRIMRIEIKKMEKREQLFAISGNIVAIISMIIAIIAFNG